MQLETRPSAFVGVWRCAQGFRAVAEIVLKSWDEISATVRVEDLKSHFSYYDMSTKIRYVLGSRVTSPTAWTSAM